MRQLNRRSFVLAAGAATTTTMLGKTMGALVGSGSDGLGQVAANDHIQIALIGAGIQGQGDAKVAVQVPGVKLDPSIPRY